MLEISQICFTQNYFTFPIFISCLHDFHFTMHILSFINNLTKYNLNEFIVLIYNKL